MHGGVVLTNLAEYKLIAGITKSFLESDLGSGLHPVLAKDMYAGMAWIKQGSTRPAIAPGLRRFVHEDGMPRLMLMYIADDKPADMLRECLLAIRGLLTHSPGDSEADKRLIGEITNQLVEAGLITKLLGLYCSTRATIETRGYAGLTLKHLTDIRPESLPQVVEAAPIPMIAKGIQDALGEISGGGAISDNGQAMAVVSVQLLRFVTLHHTSSRKIAEVAPFPELVRLMQSVEIVRADAASVIAALLKSLHTRAPMLRALEHDSIVPILLRMASSSNTMTQYAAIVVISHLSQEATAIERFNTDPMAVAKFADILLLDGDLPPIAIDARMREVCGLLVQFLRHGSPETMLRVTGSLSQAEVMAKLTSVQSSAVACPGTKIVARQLRDLLAERVTALQHTVRQALIVWERMQAAEGESAAETMVDESARTVFGPERPPEAGVAASGAAAGIF